MDYINSHLVNVSVHAIGNITNEEELICTKSPVDLADLELRELLQKFFLSPFAKPEFHQFTFSNEDFNLNPMYSFANQVFSDPQKLHAASVDMAKHLYQISIHPQIKSGDLFVAHFTQIELEPGEYTEAVGIFKSENKKSFIKIDRKQDGFAVFPEDGIDIDKMDKGCLIFNIDKETGYRVCIVDKSNKSGEAQYWRDQFLQIKPRSDDFHRTKDFMNIAKHFVTKQLSEEFEVTKADQIDLLNRSVDYFKTHETFEKEEFEETVFNNQEIIKSFRGFDNQYRQEHEMQIDDTFDISGDAVKKQSRIFKSVLKLDKNFHIYIHGNREMIEQGVDQDGRKFYKIYFKEES